MFTKPQVQNSDEAMTHDEATDKTLSKTQLSRIESGWFVCAVVGGLATTVLPGLLGISKSITSGRKCTMCNGSGEFLGKPTSPKPRPLGFGLNLKTQSRMFMFHRGKVCDITDVKMNGGIGTVLAKFLPKVLRILKDLGKSLLSG